MRGENMVWVVVAVAFGAATMTWGWRLLHPGKGVKAEGFVRRFFGVTDNRQFYGVALIVIGIIIVILALWVLLILFGDESSFFPY